VPTPSENVRAVLRPGVQRFRAATSRARILPSFLIIGAQRAGTTSLFIYLSRHPHVTGPTSGDGTVPWPKELHFFDKRFSLGLDWYRSFFPLVAARRLVRLRGHDLVAGEATPSYLFHPAAPERVAACLPEVRLIALLRNPIERAFSQYQKWRRMGREHLTFERAIESEVRPRRSRERPRSYLARGIYVEQLERWLASFPREQLLVIRSEDLMSSPAEVYGEVVDFLGVERWEPESFVLRNRASYAPIDPDLRARLEEHFAEPNARLARLLGRDFGWTASPTVELGAQRQA
jgi:Sulfotransferase domain